MPERADARDAEAEKTASSRAGRVERSRAARRPRGAGGLEPGFSAGRDQRPAIRHLEAGRARARRRRTGPAHGQHPGWRARYRRREHEDDRCPHERHFVVRPAARRHPVQSDEQPGAGGQGRGVRSRAADGLRLVPGAPDLRSPAGLEPLCLLLDQLSLGPAVGEDGAHGLREPVEHQRLEAADHASASSPVCRAAGNRTAGGEAVRLRRGVRAAAGRGEAADRNVEEDDPGAGVPRRADRNRGGPGKVRGQRLRARRGPPRAGAGGPRSRSAESAPAPDGPGADPALPLSPTQRTPPGSPPGNAPPRR